MRTDEDGGDAEPKDRRRDNGRPDTNMGLENWRGGYYEG